MSLSSLNVKTQEQCDIVLLCTVWKKYFITIKHCRGSGIHDKIVTTIPRNLKP